METGDSPSLPTLPRGRHHLTREQVRTAQRDRLLTGMVEVVADSGYAAATVGAVLKRVRISRETFYQHFADKEDCFLAAFDTASDLLIAMMEESLGSPEDPVLIRVDRVLATYLGALAAAPTLARTFLIEVYGAGRAAVTRRIAVQERFATALAEVIMRDEGWSGSLDSAFVGRAVIGAVSALVTSYVDDGSHERLPELREQFVDLVATFLRGARATP